MFSHDDLRELLILTALGALVGLVHLVLRPGLPVLAQPAAACTLAEPALAEPPPEALRSELPEELP